MRERLRGWLVHRGVGRLSRGACGLGLNELALNDKGPRRRFCSTPQDIVAVCALTLESSINWVREERRCGTVSGDQLLVGFPVCLIDRDFLRCTCMSAFTVS